MADQPFHDSRGERVAIAELDELLARMQTPAARKGMADAFNATPIQLGRAAVAEAKKCGYNLQPAVLESEGARRPWP
jgi:hypothetical protein